MQLEHTLKAHLISERQLSLFNLAFQNILSFVFSVNMIPLNRSEEKKKEGSEERFFCIVN